MSTDQVDLIVEGMHCASCVSRVSSGLEDLDGVERAEVNLATRRVSVSFDEGVLGVEAIRDQVTDLGYSASSAEEPPEGNEAELSLRRLLGAAALTVPVLVLSMVTRLQFDGWAWVAAALTTPVVFVSGREFHQAAWAAARQRFANMDTLVSVGTLAAYSWSVVALVFLGASDAAVSGDAGEAHVYFETAAVIVTLILLGRYFEARARHRSGEAIRALAQLAASTATLEDGTEVAIEELTVGDRFVVRPGEKVATDGVVVEGASAIDRSLITGEPVPVDVGPGDEVIGASINAGGHLVVRATRVGADTALAQIGRLVAEAQTRAPAQRLADRISAVFVPVVLGVAALTLAGWLALGYGVDDAFTAAVAVLIIACPCALGLATPTAILVGTGRAAQLGIIVKGGDVLEATRDIDTVVFDKTGTITEGRMELVDVIAEDPSVIARAAAVEAQSEHPIGRAISDAVSAPETAAQFSNQPGVGATAVVQGATVTVGRRSLFDSVPDELEAAATSAESTGRTAVMAGWDGEAKGVLVVADAVRATSAEAVRQIADLGLDVQLLTGDNQATADSVAAAVGIATVRAEALPGDKAAEVERLQADGRRVAFVGDGVNDAPALALADLGIAIGTGTDVAIEAADVTVVSDDPRAVADAIRLSRRTLRVIKENLFWAFFYNVAAIPLAITGLLHPMIASGAMAFSSVLVVGNSLRLRRFQGSRADDAITVAAIV